MDTIWFYVHYKDKGSDYHIYDPDKTTIFDLIADFEETAIKQNVLIPKIYDLYYKCMEGKNVALKCDADVVKMFEVMEGMQTIEIWLVDTIDLASSLAPFARPYATIQGLVKGVQLQNRRRLQQLGRRRRRRLMEPLHVRSE
ncbi:hypothetical protein vseg_003550 [Gypsophila vaccaria]